MLGGRKADIKVGGDFGTVPADKYTVQIADVNFKTRFNKWKNEEVEMLNFQYIILDQKPIFDDNGEEDGTTRGRYLWHAVSQSLSSRSWLMKLAKAVLGRDLTKEELDPSNPKFFNPESLVGKQVDVMVTEDPNKDNTAIFNNIVSYAKTARKLEPVEVENTGQTVVEAKTRPVITEVVDTPNLNPELDKFLNDVAGKDESDSEESEAEEDQEETLEELEAKIKLAKAKAKAAKNK